MISFEEAVKKAKEIRPSVDGGTEFENGYMFSTTGDDEYIGGLGHVGICIRKSDGKVIPQVTFMMNNPGEEVRDFDL